MKKAKNIIYHDEPIGKIKIIKDFLPSPEQLVLKEDLIKVTIPLSRGSVDFFKEIAEQEHVGYQKMIRALIDQYVSHYR
jgi:hypothetical protein